MSNPHGKISFYSGWFRVHDAESCRGNAGAIDGVACEERPAGRLVEVRFYGDIPLPDGTTFDENGKPIINLVGLTANSLAFGALAVFTEIHDSGNGAASLRVVAIDMHGNTAESIVEKAII